MIPSQRLKGRSSGDCAHSRSHRRSGSLAPVFFLQKRPINVILFASFRYYLNLRDQRGVVKGVGGAAGCGRSVESSLLVDCTCFLKTRKDTFSSFSEFKASCSRNIFRQSYSIVILGLLRSRLPVWSWLFRELYGSAAFASREDAVDRTFRGYSLRARR